MASTSQATPVSPDTLITVKVSHNGSMRRFKLPLRDLGASVLPDKLRSSLAIPDGQQVKFERYSDSASAYVVLDSANHSVYKQLYRAAKAKLKLRLKATLINDNTSAPPPPPPTTAASQVSAPPAYTSRVSLISPPPAPTVEDGPTEPVVETSTPTPTSAAPVVAPVSPTKSTASESTTAESDPAKLKDMVADLIKNYVNGDEYLDKLRHSVRMEIHRQSQASSIAPSDSFSPASTSTLTSTCPYRPFYNTNTGGIRANYVVVCDHCNASVDGIHYHCSTCDQGNFDLCQACVNKGIHCKGEHWLIKRRLENGQLVFSTTESSSPPNNSSSSISSSSVAKPKDQTIPPPSKAEAFASRTCNCCVTVLPDECFVTCTVCDDYDVCLPCHIAQKHGHHPGHGFKPATKDTVLDTHGVALLSPGRGIRHRAVCDGCDKQIVGVRHKCLNCPDWDYCSECVKSSRQNHPGHRFTPIYDPIHTPMNSMSVHHGIYCDGPLCKGKTLFYIIGDRYKCAVCDDTDFCANCEASPQNHHNASHPLIKMRTPIRDVSCTTIENDGANILGDTRTFQNNNSNENISSSKTTSHAATQVQTVADVEPTKEFSEKEAVESEEKSAPVQIPVSPIRTFAPLSAEYVKDIVVDGTDFKVGQKFTQTWTLVNSGKTEWPVGVRVSFVGGDHMFGDNAEDNLVASATKEAVKPGDEADFSVELTAPSVPNRRVISYWRLTSPDGSRFGHKLWCDIQVSAPHGTNIEKEAVAHHENASIAYEAEDNSSSNASSQMIFPKLDKESHVPPNTPANKSEPQSSDEAGPEEDEEDEEEEEERTVATHSPVHSPAWTVTLSEDDGHTSDAITTSEDDVESLMLDDEDYEVLETSDDDGYRRVI